jgi:hypothetical protein
MSRCLSFCLQDLLMPISVLKTRGFVMMRTPLARLCYWRVSFTYANMNESPYFLAGLGSSTLGVTLLTPGMVTVLSPAP